MYSFSLIKNCRYLKQCQFGHAGSKQVCLINLSVTLMIFGVDLAGQWVKLRGDY